MIVSHSYYHNSVLEILQSTRRPGLMKQPVRP